MMLLYCNSSFIDNDPIIGDQGTICEEMIMDFSIFKNFGDYYHGFHYKFDPFIIDTMDDLGIVKVCIMAAAINGNGPLMQLFGR